MMYLGLGVGLLAAAAVLFAWAYAAHRRPIPARWTRSEFLSSGICIVVTALIPIGGGYLAVAMLNPLETIKSLDASSLGLIAVSVALAWVLIPRLQQSVAPTAPAPNIVLPRSPGSRPASDPQRAASRKTSSKRAA